MTPRLRADLQTFFAQTLEADILHGWRKDWAERLAYEVDECRTDDEIVAAARAVVEEYYAGRTIFALPQKVAALRAAVEAADQ